jgi:hypothetical protein
MTDTRTQLKARFSAGQRIGESDFSALIDSLAHLSEDISSGSLATGDQLTQVSVLLDSVKEFAELLRVEFDSYVGTHATLEQVNAADSAVRSELNSSITSSVQSLTQADSDIYDVAIQNTSLVLDTLLYIDELVSPIGDKVDFLFASSASQDLVTQVANEIYAAIDLKASANHLHEEYLTQVDIQNFITSEDIPEFASKAHTHVASDITDLSGMFATDARVLELIEENKNTLDIDSIIADGYYSKGEVDQKFYVATWTTDQVVGFNTKVSEIATAITEVELATAATQIAEDLNIPSLESTVSNIDTNLSALSLTVSNNSSAITNNDTQVRTDFAAADTQVRTDFAAADTQVRTDFATADTQVRTDFAAADAATLTSAKSYTDGKITDLIGGAGDAYDTLKEIQTVLESGEVTGDVLTSLSNINTEIDNNDTELDNIRKWLGRTALELESSPPSTTLSVDAQAGDTTIQITNQSGFSVGDEIVIGLDGPTQEIATVTELGSLILESPLVNSHPSGTIVKLRNPLISSIQSISGGSASSSDLDQLQQDLEALQQTVGSLSTDLTNAQASIQSLNTEITNLNEEISALEEQLAGAVYSEYNYFSRYYVLDGYAQAV